MLSHNNWRARIDKYEPKKQRFTLKKLTIGVASVLLGFAFAGTSTASADDGNQQGVKPEEGAANQDNNATVATASQATLTTTAASASTASTTPAASQASADDIKQDQANSYEQRVAAALNQSLVQANASSTATPSSAPAANSAATDQDATQIVRYVNNANTNEVVGTQPFTGKVGTVVDIYNNLHAPANWQLVGGQSVQTTAVLQANANPIDVLVEHQKEVEYGFQHKEDRDVYRKITREITYNFPGEAPQKYSQAVTYYRNKTTDKVSNTATYSDWEANTVDEHQNKVTSFGQFEVPAVPGYQAAASGAHIISQNGKQYLAAVDVTADTPSVSVTVNYAPETHQLVINYVDQADHNKVVASQTVTGYTGQHVAIELHTPANWKIVSGQQVLNGMTFGSSDPAAQTVYVEHANTDVTNDPSIADQLQKTVVYTVKGVMGDQDYMISQHQLTFHRTATKDSVTGAVIYGKWSNDRQVPAVKVAQDGYSAKAYDQNGQEVAIVNGQLPAMTVTPDTPDTTITVIYNKDNEQPSQGNQDEQGDRVVRFNVFDNVNGQLLSTTTVTGKTGETVPVHVDIPYGWVVAPGTTLPTSYTFPATATVDQQIYVMRDKTNNDLNRTVTRQILANVQGTGEQGTQIGLQRVDFMRSGMKDSVTGQMTYGDWKQEGTIDAFQIPQRAGYTTQVDGQNVTELPAENVNADSKSSVVTVVYVPTKGNQTNPAQEQTIHINFVEKATGKIIGSTPLSGKAGQTVAIMDIIDQQMPTNWEKAIDEPVQNDVTFNQTVTPDVTVYIEHGREYQANRTVNVGNRILAHYDDGRVVQLGGVTTDAPVRVYKDLVTGQLVDEDFAGTVNIPAFTIPEKPGYTIERVEGPDITNDQTRTIPAMTASHTTDGVRTYTVYYVSNKQTAKINYVDSKDHSKVVATQTVTGKTNQAVDITLDVPAGWEIVGGQNVPSSITFGTTGSVPDSTVYVQHKFVNQEPEVKEVKQTINGVNPVTGVSQPLREMTVKFSRPVAKDMVTNELVKGDWNRESYTFDGYNVHQLAGYTAQLNGQNVVLIPAETVTPDSQNTVYTVTYRANTQQVHINFVDANDHSNTVATQTVTGKTAETVNVNLQVPAGWQVTGGQNVPTAFTFGSTPLRDATVYIEHKTTPVNPTDKGELSKTVTRTVHAKYPDGQEGIAHQDMVTFTRTGSTDLVTGQTTYSKWNEESHHFGDVAVQQIPGYTSYVNGTAATTIPGEDVTPTSASQTDEVTYKANEQSTEIKYVDAADHRNVVAVQNVAGKTGETVNVTLQVPANWQLVGGQQVPSSFTFGGTPFADTTVYVEHQTADTTDTTDKAATHRTVSRVVKANINGTTTVLSSINAEFSRTATKDLVTGETTYGPWTKNFTAPAVKVAQAGYTAQAVDQHGQQVAIVDGQIPATTLTPDTADELITVNYTANDQVTHINYVDSQTKKTVGSQTITGKTGESVGVKLDVPANYQIVSGQQVPASFTFGANPIADTTVYVEPAKTPVNPGQPGDPNHADTNRTVTRTIYATGAGYNHGVLHQDMANFTRGGMYDPINHTITYNPWNEANETFAAFEIPVRDGYQALVDGKVVTEIPATTVNPDSKSTTVEVTYEPVEQSMKINFVNKDNHSEVIGSQTVAGKTGETVPVTLQVPAGWRMVGGQSVPSGIGFGSKPHADVTIYVEHATQDVTNDQDQAAQTHRTIRHVVNEVINGQTVTVASVNAEFYRTATKDLTTGKVVYGDWTKNVEFPAVNVARTGYTATAKTHDGQNVELINGQVPATVITPASQDETITVTYTANDQSTKINYVNVENNQPVGSQTITGKTGETVSVNLEVPAGYEVVSGQQVPASITFGSNQVADSTVYVQTKKNPVNPDQPGDQPGKPSTPSTIDNQRVVKRAINATDPTGRHILLNQAIANFTRPASIDSVTGKVIYGPWNETSHVFPEFQLKQAYGYETQIDGKTVTSVPAETVGLDSKDQTIEVVYVPVEQTAKINYVNKDNQQVISTQTVTGKTGETVPVSLDVPAGWQVVNGQTYPTAIGFGGKAQTDWNILVEPKANPTSQSTEKRTVSRVVNAVVDGQTSQLASATVEFSRTVTTDTVTGKKTYGEWSKGTSFPAVNVNRAGYTAVVTDQNGHAVEVVNGQIPAETVTADTPSQTITVNYTADGQTTHINYVDSQTKQTVGSQTITGKTGETVNVSLNVPANYQVVSGQQVPSSFTFGSTPIADTTVYVEPAATPVNPGQPGDPNHADTNRTVTRTIYATGAGYNHGVLHQDMANFTRGGMYDPINHTITYNPWDKANETFAAFEIPVRDGYQALVDGKVVTAIPAVTVNPDSQSTTVEVTYEPVEQSMKINFVNKDNHSEIVGSQTVTGKTGETVPVNLQVPAGWRMVGGQSVPSGIGFGSKPHADVTVYVEHDSQDLTNDPSQASQTHRVVNHVINEVFNGKTTTVASVKAEFNRTATKDLATGKVIYGDWTKNVDFPAVSVVRGGYTATANNQAGQAVDLVNGQVPATVITPDSQDETITVTYTANDQSTTITYVNAKTKQPVGSQTVTGKTGETVNVNLEVPAGYEVVGGQQVPSSITFGANQVPGATVYVQAKATTPTTPDQPGDQGNHGDHGSQPTKPTDPSTIDNQRIVKRTINATDPTGRHILLHQDVANFTRTAQVDSVTGEVTYGPWNQTSQEFAAFKLQQEYGYVTQVNGQTVTEVPAATVGLDSHDQTVEVVYVPVEQTAKINYINKDQQVVGSQTITGKTGENVKVNLNVPAGWQIANGQTYPTTIGFGGQPQTDWNILVEPTSADQGNHGNDDQPAQTQRTTINFVNKANGEVVGSQTVTGKAGETVNVSLQIPEGYEVSDGQQVPSSYTFGTKPIADATVYVQAKTTPVNPGQPGDPNHADTNRTVTRTIYATGAGYKHGVLHQDMANFMRGGTYDPTTGLISYQPWNKESEDFAAFTIPVRDGYQAMVDGKVVTAIPAVTVNPDSKSTTIEVTYEPVEQSMTINFVNKDNHGEVVASQTVTGKTGETVPVNLQVPAGWRMVGSQSVPSGIGFGSKPHADITVYVEHASQDVTNDQDQANQTHRVINHVINEVFNGKTTTVASVKAEFNRTATKDLATGKVVYGDWTKNVDFPAVAVTRGGYTATAKDQDGQVVELVDGKVPATTITPDSKDMTITVNYTADDQTMTINFVNKGNNQVVASQPVNGKTGETVNINLEVPAGWQVVGGQQVPATITFGAKPVADATVYIEPAAGSDATKPGSSAASGNSSAAEPGSSAASDNSSAAKPGSSASSNNSSTAEPGSSAASDNSSAAEPGSSAASGNSSAAEPGSSATSGNSSAAEPGSSATSGNSNAAKPSSSATSDNSGAAEPGSSASSNNSSTAEPGSSAASDNSSAAKPGSTATSGNSSTAEPGSSAASGNSSATESGSSATSGNSSTAEPGSTATSGNSSAAEPGSSTASDNSSAAKPGSSATSDNSSTAEPGSTATSDDSGAVKPGTKNPVNPHGDGEVAEPGNGNSAATNNSSAADNGDNAVQNNGSAAQANDSTATGDDATQPGNSAGDNGNGNNSTIQPGSDASQTDDGVAENASQNGNAAGMNTANQTAANTAAASDNPAQQPVQPVVPHANGGETQSHSKGTNTQSINAVPNSGQSQAAATSSNNAQRLPQTGNANAAELAMAGLGLAGFAGVLGATSRKKKRQ
ncbi:mucin-binding protein [Limosilactobacillus caccae]|uniref:mucin-binding protein n=1 Tax=Limosilactobacillus caccae TaxID=1926284 RepID=UPI0009704BEB|nr:MucBP domain-containing protein [Limosilactobacillus caccae]